MATDEEERIAELEQTIRRTKGWLRTAVGFINRGTLDNARGLLEDAESVLAEVVPDERKTR